MDIATAGRDPAEFARGHLADLQLNRLMPTRTRAFAAATPTGMTLSYQGVRSVRQQHKSWSGVSASVAQMQCDGGLWVDLGADAGRLSVALEEVGGQFIIQSKDFLAQRSGGDFARPLSIIPARLNAHGKAEGLRFLRHLVIQFDLAALGRVAEDEIDLAKVFAPRLMFADSGIMRLAHLFADECVGEAPHSLLYGDNLSIALLLALSRLCGTKPPSTKTKGHLAPWQLRRVSEYLDAHLAEDIPLHALSDLVKLSRSYFSRAFKISTGLAPHQWLVQARIAKAKQLMLESDRPLAHIAIDVGFADQSHFTRTFGRAVGESPNTWRRDRLPDR